jgi:GNAT superfamily N-acetyltransferase
MQTLYGVHPHHPEEAVEQDIQEIGKFQPPCGQLILAVYEGKVCGLGSLKKINAEIGEIKRMFVDPDYRRIGAGRGNSRWTVVGSKEGRLHQSATGQSEVHGISACIISQLRLSRY